MLSGIEFIKKGNRTLRSNSKPCKKREKDCSNNAAAVVRSHELKVDTGASLPSGSGESQKNRDALPASTSSVVESTRDAWMLGNFDELFNENTLTSRQRSGVRHSQAERPNPDSITILRDRELNPFFSNGGDGLPPLRGPCGDETPYRESKPFHGDTGTKKELVPMKKHYDQHISSAKLYHSTIKKRETRPYRHLAKELTENTSCEEYEIKGVRQTTTTKTMEDQEDPNLAALKKLKIQLGCSNAQTLPDSFPPDSFTRVLEDVDTEGKYIPLVEATCQRGYKERAATGNVSLQQLHRETRVKGVEDFDAIMRRDLCSAKRNGPAEGAEYDDLIHPDYFYKNQRSNAKTFSAFRRTFRQGRIKDTKALYERESKCLFCPESVVFRKIRNRTLIAMSQHAYMCYQTLKQAVVEHHLFISPIAHVGSSATLDDIVYQDIRNFQKSLVAYLDTRNIAVIFVESMGKKTDVERTFIGGGNHLVIDCFGLPLERFEESKAYFRKALLDSGDEWCQNKKLIPVPKSNRGCRGILPSHFPYFYVNFGLGEGYLHLIEDDKFCRTLGQDVIRGMMEMDSCDSYFSSPEPLYEAVERFKKNYAQYDWTTLLRAQN